MKYRLLKTDYRFSKIDYLEVTIFSLLLSIFSETDSLKLAHYSYTFLGKQTVPRKTYIL
jgi:hypothetical protein